MNWVEIKFRELTEEERTEAENCNDDNYNFVNRYECKLPKDEEDVLITTSDGDVVCTVFHSECGGFFEDYEGYDEVVAWMSLPRPYKKK